MRYALLVLLLAGCSAPVAPSVDAGLSDDAAAVLPDAFMAVVSCEAGRATCGDGFTPFCVQTPSRAQWHYDAGSNVCFVPGGFAVDCAGGAASCMAGYSAVCVADEIGVMDPAMPRLLASCPNR